MKDSRKKKRFAFLFVLLLGFVSAGGIFFFRAPLLFVTDSSFNTLYGSRRLLLRGAEISLRSFRRVIPALVSESAGPGQTALAVEALSSKPGAVFFPARYLEGAGVYAENHPGTRVFVLGGRNARPLEKAAFCFVRTDTANDLYRAGLCAGFLAGESRDALFFGEGFSAGARAAFREGLGAAGFTREPLYPGAGEIASGAVPGCAVLAAPAAEFLERYPETRIILFSWLDPALSPRTVKVVFDDSPWALALDILAAPFSEEILVPSKALVLRDRMEEKEDFRKIRGFLEDKTQKR